MTFQNSTRQAAWFASVVGVALISFAAPAHGGSEHEALSRRPLPESAAWRSHIVNTPGPYAAPRSVSVEGEGGTVTDAEALLGAGGTTLMTTKAHGARIVVDFGALVSGYVEL